MILSPTASKSLALDLAAVMKHNEGELTLTYAQSYVARLLRAKGVDTSAKTVEEVLNTGTKRGYFRIFRKSVLAPLASAVSSTPVKKTEATMEPTSLRSLMQMYWDDETLNERCTLGAGSRPTLDTAINRVNLVAGEYILDGTKTEKQVRRDVENLLEKRFPDAERATTSNYAGNVLHHILGLAKADGQVSFAA